MALHPSPCPTWHPSPQAAPCVHPMWVVVQSMGAGASLPRHTSKGVRQVSWQRCSASVHGTQGSIGSHQVCQLGSWAVLTAQGSLGHKLCVGVSECLRIAHLLFRNNYFPPNTVFARLNKCEMGIYMIPVYKRCYLPAELPSLVC